MAVTINSNIPALNAQRRLLQSTSRLESAYQRLASGLRIVKAGDDAAGLAISSSLNADTRIFTQAIRNVNDGISALNVAEGTLDELTNITIRIKELAEQSASGVYSSSQRSALDKEAQALRNEYARIVNTASFNGISFFTAGGTQFDIQAGAGPSSTLAVTLGDALMTAAGDGTFTAGGSVAGPGTIYATQAADLNADGKVDLVWADYDANTLSVALGNGDGTFRARVSIPTGSGPDTFVLADLNNDGRLDILEANYAVSPPRAYLGNGDGTFLAPFLISTPQVNSSHTIFAVDLNGDGNLDMVNSTHDPNVFVALGNGNGTFRSTVSYRTATNFSPSASVGDLNGDGFIDIVGADINDGTFSVLLGNGDGTFKAFTTFFGQGISSYTELGDVNNDGILDLVSSDFFAGAGYVRLGNGNGTFRVHTSYALPSTQNLIQRLVDINEDGNLDFLSGSNIATGVGVLLGNGDGSFKAYTTGYVGNVQANFAAADFNGDSALDLAVATVSQNSVVILLGNPVPTAFDPIDLSTQDGALEALGTATDALTRISREKSNIGAVQSRLLVANNVLAASRENYAAAASQIMDADVAEETANLVRTRILQQAGAAVLAQANQGPALALTLLGV